MEQFLIIFHQQIKLQLLRRKNFINNSLFFLSFFIIFVLIITPLQSSFKIELSSESKYQSLITCASIFALLFSLLASSFEFLQEDFRDGTLEQIMIKCSNFEIYFFAKMIANWLSNCLFNVVLAVFLSWLLGLSVQFLSNFFLLFFLASLLINFICCFGASLAILQGSISLIAFIILPLILPIVIFSCLAILDNFAQHLKILLGLNIFLIPLLTFSSGILAKIALD